MKSFINKNSKIIYHGNEISFPEISNNVDIIATNINNSIIADRKKIIIYLHPTPQMIYSILAVLKLGYTYIPIDINTPKHRIDYILKDCQADVIITSRNYKYSFKNINVICIEELVSKSSFTIYQHHIANNNAFIIYTSGSTGNPKGVKIKYDSLFNFVEGVSERIAFIESRIISCFSNVAFDMFFLDCIFPLSKGMTVVLADENEQKNPYLISKLIKNNNVDLLVMTPARMLLLIEYDKTFSSLVNVKDICIGGDAFPLNLLKKIQNNTSANIFNAYGPTETTILSSIGDLTNSNTIHIGTPLLNTEIYIINDDLELVEDGEIGEIGIAGMGLAEGYINNNELTEQKFVYPLFAPKTRLYKSGDFGRYNKDGFIECLGRKDNQIKLNAFRIELEEIEAALNSCKGIESSLVMLKDNKLYALYKSSKKLDSKYLHNSLGELLPDYMIPFDFVLVNNFRYNANGKIDRKASYDMFLNMKPNKSTNDVINTSEDCGSVDQAILIIINDIIKSNKQISADDTLKESGLDSLDFVKIIIEIENKFGFQFEDEELQIYNSRKISSLISYVKSRIEEN